MQYDSKWTMLLHQRQSGCIMVINLFQNFDALTWILPKYDTKKALTKTSVQVLEQNITVDGYINIKVDTKWFVLPHVASFKPVWLSSME